MSDLLPNFHDIENQSSAEILTNASLLIDKMSYLIDRIHDETDDIDIDSGSELVIVYKDKLKNIEKMIKNFKRSLNTLTK